MLLEPRVFGDARGFFFESFNHAIPRLTGPRRIRAGQLQPLGPRRPARVAPPAQPQAKLVRVARGGAIYDVAVDLRKSSRTFGCWVGAFLSAENHKQLWIPEGFAHGFQVISQAADVLYKTNDYYFPEPGRIRWNDPAIGINWPLALRRSSPTRTATAPCWPGRARTNGRHRANPEHEPWTPPPACAGQGTSPCGS